MSISGSRLALVGGAILVLGVVGLGVASAAPRSSLSAAPLTSPAPISSAGPASAGAGDGAWRPRLGGVLKRIVHGAVTVDTPGQGLVTVQLDHGTLQTIGQGTITISEAGGARVTIATASDTRVRRNGQRGNVDDLRAGDTVYALSGIPEDGGNPVARLILVPQVPES